MLWDSLGRRSWDFEDCVGRFYTAAPSTSPYTPWHSAWTCIQTRYFQSPLNYAVAMKWTWEPFPERSYLLAERRSPRVASPEEPLPLSWLPRLCAGCQSLALPAAFVDLESPLSRTEIFSLNFPCLQAHCWTSLRWSWLQLLGDRIENVIQESIRSFTRSSAVKEKHPVFCMINLLACEIIFFLTVVQNT